MDNNLHRASILKVIRGLEALRRTAQGDLHQAQTASSQELSSYDNHPADQAADTVRRELDLGLIRGLEERLAEAQRALEKVEEGSYGQCDQCRRSISAARLTARPESVLCMRCAAEAEERDIPPSDHGLIQPMSAGAKGLDPTKSALDFWNDMAQWGTSDTPQDDPPARRYEEMFGGVDNPTGAVTPVETYVGADEDVLWETAYEESPPGRSSRQHPLNEEEAPFDSKPHEKLDR